MPDHISEQLILSFDQARNRGLPASATVGLLAKKFHRREHHVIYSLRNENRICTTSFQESSILWNVHPEAPTAENPNMLRHMTADLIQCGINPGLALGVISEAMLADSAPQQILREHMPRIMGKALDVTSEDSPSNPDSDLHAA